MMEESESNQQKLLPKCGYQLETIYFYLTEGCNLKCKHCWIGPKFQTEKTIWPSLDFKLFKDIIRQGKKLGLLSVKLTGGEPLIHPEINKILDHIYVEELNLTIETNGVKCTPDIVDKIIKCKNPFVSVSLDGGNADSHEWVRGVRGCFSKAIIGIRNLVNAKLKPEIIMSVMRHNKDQLEAVVRLAEQEGAGSVKFNLVTPTVARGEQMHEAQQTLCIKELVDLGFWVENTLATSTKMRIVYSHPPAFRPISRLFGKADGHCSIFGIIGVLGNGKYALCGIGETVPELVFGHAEKDKLIDVWNNNKVLNDIRAGLPKNLKGICRNCVIKKNCLGSCVAMNYYKYKDLFASNWYCEEACKLGLFPTTRICSSPIA